MELQSLRSMARCTNYRHQMPGQERIVCPMDARSHERAAMGPALVLEAQDGMDSGWQARVKAGLKVQEGIYVAPDGCLATRPPLEQPRGAGMVGWELMQTRAILRRDQ